MLAVIVKAPEWGELVTLSLLDQFLVHTNVPVVNGAVWEVECRRHVGFIPTDSDSFGGRPDDKGE